MASNHTDWPALPLEVWKETRDTLQLYVQMAGKIRLGLAPMEPEWAQVPLYVTSRGLTTSPMPFGPRTFEIEFNFIAHRVEIAVSDGQTATIKLEPRTVASFYDELMSNLAGLGIDVQIMTLPQEIPNPIRFTDDKTHAAYDPQYANRFWRILTRVDQAFKRHRAPFRGRHTPVQFFWGTFDLAYVRYSGRPATPPPNSGLIYRFGADAEQIECGFWAGDQRFAEPAFFCFEYPKPPGIENAKVGPQGASWNAQLGEFLLPYEVVRSASSPDNAIAEFLASTYQAAARAADWDPAFTAPLA